MFQLLRNVASLREESSEREPWELTDDPAKYMWRLDDVKNLDTWFALPSLSDLPAGCLPTIMFAVQGKAAQRRWRQGERRAGPASRQCLRTLRVSSKKWPWLAGIRTRPL